jgi:hypothetical protein
MGTLYKPPNLLQLIKECRDELSTKITEAEALMSEPQHRQQDWIANTHSWLPKMLLVNNWVPKGW